jgi:putative mycofactocin binding protein MftB
MTETPSDRPGEFDPALGWALHPQVALRDEEFGALAYHYGNRRLVFLKSRPLVELVKVLADHETASDAIASVVEPAHYAQYEAALARLATSEVIGVR